MVARTTDPADASGDDRRQIEPASIEPASIEPMLTPAVRSVISLLLLIHIVCVAVMLSSSLAPSSLQTRLVELFSPYVSALALDPTGKELFLTHGDVDDVDWRIEWRGADDPPDVWHLGLPQARLRVGWERRREQRLNWEVASRFLEEDNDEAIAAAGRLVAAISRWLVSNQPDRPVEIRLRRHTLQRPDAVDATDERDRNAWSSAYFDTLYRASIVVDGDRVRIVRRTAAQEEAPVRRPNSLPSEGTP